MKGYSKVLKKDAVMHDKSKNASYIKTERSIKMAGINPNLGNLKLQNLQLSKTAEVDTQEEKGKEVGEAKPAAVWLANGHTNGSGRKNTKVGDVFVTIQGDKITYERLVLDEKGERRLMPINANDVHETDFEEDRGDITELW